MGESGNIMLRFHIAYEKGATKYIDELPKNFEKGNLKGLRKAMFFVEGKAKAGFAEGGPVRKPPGPLVARTGHLRRSIKSGVKDHRIGWVKATVSYGRLHELGIGRMPARPFLRPAIEDNIERIKQFIRESIVKETK